MKPSMLTTGRCTPAFTKRVVDPFRKITIVIFGAEVELTGLLVEADKDRRRIIADWEGWKWIQQTETFGHAGLYRVASFRDTAGMAGTACEIKHQSTE